MVGSTLNGKNYFKNVFMTAINEEEFYYILQDNFEKIMKLFEKINELKLKQKNINKKRKDIYKKEYEIEDIFVKTQEMLYKKYFDRLFVKVDTNEKVEDFKRIIMEYKIYIIERNSKERYSEYMQYKLMQLDRKVIEINRRNTKNALSLWKENKLMSILQRLKEMILKEQ